MSVTVLYITHHEHNSLQQVFAASKPSFKKGTIVSAIVIIRVSEGE